MTQISADFSVCVGAYMFGDGFKSVPALMEQLNLR